MKRELNRRVGPNMSLQRFVEGVDSIFENELNRARISARDRGWDVHYARTNSREPKATAELSKGNSPNNKYEFAFSQGLCQNLAVIGLVAMFHPEVEQNRPFYLNPYDAVNEIKALDWKKVWEGDLEILDQSLKMEALSMNRLTFGGAAAKQAFEFVFYHEVAHVIEGHLDWLQKQHLADKYYKLDPITAQALEFQADMNSFRVLVTYSDVELCKQIGMGLSILFAVLNHLDQFDVRAFSSHTNPISRCLLALAAANSVCPEKAFVISDAFLNTQRALSSFGIITLDTPSIDEVVEDSIYAEQLGEIEIRLLELESEITPPIQFGFQKELSPLLYVDRDTPEF
jgi:hypothetical protein